MIFYRLTLQYLGTRFSGWQKQPDQLTVQGELDKTLEKIFQEPIRTIGSGRTDAGVHALGQVVKVEATKQIDVDGLKRALNSLLPTDIFCLEAQNCAEDFHPILSAKEKTYQYLFKLGPERAAPFEAPMLAVVNANMDQQLLNAACQKFIGTFDFQNYFCVGTDVPSTVRTITECSCRKWTPQGPWESLQLSGDIYIFHIQGNGFLKQMVRLIVATVWRCAQGKVSLEEIERSLQGPKSKHLAPVAPPQGLYLKQVHY